MTVLFSAPAAAPNFTGDPYSNIVWQNRFSGEGAVWQIIDGQFAEAILFDAPTLAPSTGWEIVEAGHLIPMTDSSELLWRNYNTGENGLWLMDGTDFISAVSLPAMPLDSGWDVVGVADFTADGNDDILWRNSLTGENGVWVMNNGQFQSAISLNSLSPAFGWEIAGVGDFSGDMAPDILWRNSTTGENGVWEMNGTTFVSSSLLTSVDPTLGWEIVDAGYFNSDDSADILWRNSGTGENGIWLMEGTSIGSIASLPTVAPSAGWDASAVSPIGFYSS